jgi:hypothetical protein
VPTFESAFHAATRGWPRASLACVFAATVLTMLQPWVGRRFAATAIPRVLKWSQALLALGAGCVMVPWALDAATWGRALNYRFVMSSLSAGFFTLATIEGIFEERRDAPAGAPDLWSARRAAILAAGVSFLLLFVVQGLSWRALNARFVHAIESKEDRCISPASLPVGRTTVLGHWASCSLAIVLQGRAPPHLMLAADECERWSKTGWVRIASWDDREPRHGWFRLPE